MEATLDGGIFWLLLQSYAISSFLPFTTFSSCGELAKKRLAMKKLRNLLPLWEVRQGF